MASESADKPALNAPIAEKMRQLADLITAELAGQSAARSVLDRFKCTTDYACTGQEFTCSSFRCPGSFKVQELQLRELESR
jgi:hypothetical protein